jgi:hypothetical protein
LSWKRRGHCRPLLQARASLGRAVLQERGRKGGAPGSRPAGAKGVAAWFGRRRKKGGGKGGKRKRRKEKKKRRKGKKEIGKNRRKIEKRFRKLGEIPRKN